MWNLRSQINLRRRLLRGRHNLNIILSFDIFQFYASILRFSTMYILLIAMMGLFDSRILLEVSQHISLTSNHLLAIFCHRLLNLHRVANHVDVRSNINHLSHNDLQLADPSLIEFAEIVHDLHDMHFSEVCQSSRIFCLANGRSCDLVVSRECAIYKMVAI